MDTTDTSTRPHRSNSISSSTANNNSSSSSSSELFICFTSRLSASSSMKMPSKSILSLGRSHISLSSSLSRRLRSNGSLKGGGGGGGQASPMFPSSNGKKRGGSGFENPEPSSPKVTCIGQVRVKTKKQARKNRTTTRSKSRREISFRKLENQPSSAVSAAVSGGAHGGETSTGAGNVNLEISSYHGGSAHGGGSHGGGATTAGAGSGNLEIPSYQFQQQHRNQRWVHLPMTICEALRGFGAEFNCFVPCKSSAGERGKEERVNGSDGGGRSSCGGAVLRWLVAVPDSQGKTGRDIELLVGEAEVEEEDNARNSQRRHVFEGLDIENLIKESKFTDHGFEKGGEEGRVSICIPPKNALLLMRCRSDPVKMAALANKFWECPPPDEAFEEEEPENCTNKEEEKMGIEDLSNSSQEDDKVEIFVENKEKIEEEPKQVFEETGTCENCIEDLGNGEDFAALEEEDLGHEVNESVVCEGEDCQEIEKAVDNEQFEEQIDDASNGESLVDLENSGIRENELDDKDNEVIVLQENDHSLLEEGKSNEEEELVIGDGKIECDDISNSDMVSLQKEDESELVLIEERKIEEEQVLEETQVEALPELTEETYEITPEEETQSIRDLIMQEPETCSMPEQIENKLKPNVEKEKPTGLPDCLLLMMCEPKLSMEVSKETWVCGTDFIRWLPERPQPQRSKSVNKTSNEPEPERVINRESKKRPSIDSKPKNFQLQPPRSSCSFPAAPPPKAVPRGGSATTMASMVEQKLAGSSAYEPFVLTRCKSEPMRTASKLAAPEACCWKNRKLEPHRPAATLGVGAAAGLGF